MAASYFGRNYSALSLPIAHGAQAGLRHAQVAAAHALSAHFFSGRAPAIVAMPTGSGKTGVMVLAAFLLRAQRVLVVTPSRMVRDQVAESMGSLAILKKAGAVHRAVELPHTHVVRHLISSDADWRKLEEKDIVVSTIACVSPKPPGVPLPPADLFDLVLLDEAHHAPAPSWHALRTALPGARVVLFTATPFRRDGRTLPGKIVFEYPLARAREDGVFGHVTYEPVLVDPSEDADVAIARAATRRLIADRAAGHPHLLMVRTAERARARELEAIYQRQGVPLKLVLGDISARAMRETVAKLEDGSLHGIICVDMLGEGFDLPALKIAALHSPHRSLAVTLQFIGRFARTSSESNLGQAAFFAVPADIEGDVGPLFREGAEWNEIVEATSRNRIEAEKELRDVFDSFSLNEFDGEAGDEKGLQVSDLSPKFHVKAFLAPTVDLTFPIELPHRGKVILSRKSDKYKSVVIVTKDTQVCRWSRDERVADVKYDLLIVHYHAASGILFLCSTRKEIAVYDAVAGSVSGGNFRLLSPVELNRVLRGISKLQIFSLGMRRRIGREEAYRMTSGRAADKAVRKSDGRHYDRGHCYGKGEDGGAAVTVGFSSASKVWSAMSGSLPRLLDWCGKLAGKISDPSEFTTGCGLDHLPLESRVDKFPAGIFMCDWHHKFYSDPSFSISWDGGKGSVPIVDLELCLISVSVEEVVFSVAGRGVSIEVGYRLDRSPDLFRVSACSVGPVEVVSDDGRVTLEEAMREWPPSFYTASLGRLEGERLSGTPSVSQFDVSSIEVVDWAAHGVDPMTEKSATSRGRSLFEWLNDKLLAETNDVVVNDDGTGEAADFVAIRRTRDGAHVALYHCKAVKKEPIPGQRVQDLYEVVGQAVKGARMTYYGALRDHLLDRIKKNPKRLLKGHSADLARILGDDVPVNFRVVLVQPGIGASLSESMDQLLAAADAYLSGANVLGLAVIGTVSK